MRRIYLWNDDWTLELPGKIPELVQLPHTWNGIDGQNGGDNYLRCVGKYTKHFPKPQLEEGEICLLHFKGVNSEAEVILNGKKLCRHQGGYSSFRVNITKHLQEENELIVLADNRKNDTVYPQKADFTFYGGIYRDVELVILPENHFRYGKYGAPALKITSKVEENKGMLQVEGGVHGRGKIKVSVLEADGRVVAEDWVIEQRAAQVEENPKTSGNAFWSCILSVPEVHLWNGRPDPYLYTVKAELWSEEGDIEKTGENSAVLLDVVEGTTGFRSFQVDPNKGFFLNGKPYPLRGVCRHQDRPNIGNALTTKEHDEDMELIMEMGANTVRLAHYQHDQYFYDLCDRKGLIVWAEIPYISQHMSNANDNAMQQLKELIHQNYNHPSIVCWCISNEITMKYAGEDCVQCHGRLHRYCHRTDPSRLTVIACYMPMRAGHPVAHTTDLVSYNLYFGWYLPYTQLAARKLDAFHRRYPATPVGLSEYGAEAMPNLHSEKPRRGDNTEEYQCIYHEKMLEIIQAREYLWATHVWNMFDFAADARNQGGEPGMNHKGLVTFDRKTRKDAFYLYKSFWSDEPFVHICGKRFVNRTGTQTQVTVYSNQKTVTLYHNGRKTAVLKGNGVFRFTIELEERNHLKVVAGGLKDEAEILRVAKPDASYQLKKGSNNKSWEK